MAKRKKIRARRNIPKKKLEIKGGIAGLLGAITPFTIASGITMISGPVFGYLLIGLGLQIGWIALILTDWFKPLKKRWVQYGISILIILATSSSILLSIYFNRNKQQSSNKAPSVSTKIDNSPNSTTYAAG